MDDTFLRVIVTSFDNGFSVTGFRNGDSTFNRVGSVSIDGDVGINLENIEEVVFENRVNVEIADYTDEHGYREAVISANDGSAIEMRI